MRGGGGDGGERWGGEVILLRERTRVYRLSLKELAAFHRVNLWGFRGILGLLRCSSFSPSLFVVVVTPLKGLPGFSTTQDKGGGGRARRAGRRRGGSTSKSRRLTRPRLPDTVFKIQFLTKLWAGTLRFRTWEEVETNVGYTHLFPGLHQFEFAPRGRKRWRP